jgi:uncharacterized protein (TIGR02145 family)
MKTKIYSLFAILTLSVTVWSQGVGINETGSNPNPSAILDVESTDKGFLPPRMNLAQRNAISNPATGLMIYNTTYSCLQVNDGTPASPLWNCISNAAGIPDGVIATINCAGATNNGTLTEGQAASGVNSVIAYTGGNGGAHSGQVVNSTGVTGLTATLVAGYFANGAGNLTYTITGTPTSEGTASFAIIIGGLSCTLTRTLPIATINCAAATNNGTLTEGQAASGVNSVITYTGGNGSAHSGQVVTSTGVTGLTATLSVGTFANGVGTLTYTITGTPSSTGTASFAINIGGQSCTLTRTIVPAFVPIICNPSNPTAIVDVTNGFTGKTWMDRNLGANRAATLSSDPESYGSLYQWGRGSDGHQCVNRFAGDGVTTSATTTTLSSSDTPQHGNFILTSTSPSDWRSPQNNNLWQGVSGTNNPCPTGYRLPTETELNNERLSWVQAPISSTNNRVGAFASPLKLPVAGYRTFSSGQLGVVGTYGYYWSSTIFSTNARFLSFDSTGANLLTSQRATGFSVRCLKD